MVGRELAELFAKTAAVDRRRSAARRGMSRCRAIGAGGRFSCRRRVALACVAAKWSACSALMGAGRTELLQTIFGLHPRTCDRASIVVDGRSVRIRSPRDAIAAGLALAPEDRKAEGLVLSMSVAENVSLACLDSIVRRDSAATPRAKRELVWPLRRRLARQDAVARPAGPQPQRRQPAEGRARQVAGHRAAKCCCSTSRRAASTSTPSAKSTR